MWRSWRPWRAAPPCSKSLRASWPDHPTRDVPDLRGVPLHALSGPDPAADLVALLRDGGGR